MESSEAPSVTPSPEVTTPPAKDPILEQAEGYLATGQGTPADREIVEKAEAQKAVAAAEAELKAMNNTPENMAANTTGAAPEWLNKTPDAGAVTPDATTQAPTTQEPTRGGLLSFLGKLNPFKRG